MVLSCMLPIRHQNLSLELQQHTVVCQDMDCLEEMWSGLVAVMVVVPWWEDGVELLQLVKVGNLFNVHLIIIVPLLVIIKLILSFTI